MERLNKEEEELVIDAVNQYWHQAQNELLKKGLGDIERKNWEGIKTKCSELLRKMGSF
jgi:predicted NACHT family NTPase